MARSLPNFVLPETRQEDCATAGAASGMFGIEFAIPNYGVSTSYWPAQVRTPCWHCQANNITARKGTCMAVRSTRVVSEEYHARRR